MTKAWLFDSVERTVRTALIAWLTWWSALSAHEVSDLWSHDAVLTLVTATVGSVIICLGASQVGQPDTASLRK